MPSLQEGGSDAACLAAEGINHHLSMNMAYFSATHSMFFEHLDVSCTTPNVLNFYHITCGFYLQSL
jgi:hypothetical protein